MFGLRNYFTILDVGCGGGGTIQKLARVSSKGLVLGIDYAAGSVATSHRLNAGLIKSGRMRIFRAEVSHLSFRKDQFDVVISVESQYYWPDLINDTGKCYGFSSQVEDSLSLRRATREEGTISSSVRRCGC